MYPLLDVAEDLLGVVVGVVAKRVRRRRARVAAAAERRVGLERAQRRAREH